MIAAPYWALLRVRNARTLAGSLLFYTLGAAMTPLATVLFARQATGSFSRASAVVAAGMLGTALLSPLRGQWVDRAGMRAPLVIMALARSAALAALIEAGNAGGDSWVLVIFSLVAGASSPPLAAAVRTVWNDVARGRSQVNAAFALFSMLTQTTLFAGPLAAALVIAVASPAAALGSGAALSVAAVFAFVRVSTLRDEAPADEHGGRLFGAIASPGLRTLIAVSLGYGLAFGQLEDIALPAFARSHGSSPAAGILLAAVALGIGSGSFAYGLRKSTRGSGASLPRLCGLSALGLVPSLAAASIPTMAVAMLFAGLAFAPAIVCLYSLIDDVAPAPTRTEAFGWLLSSNWAGAAVGSVLAGALVDGPGVTAALISAVAAASGASVAALAGRQTLVPVLPPTSA